MHRIVFRLRALPRSAPLQPVRRGFSSAGRPPLLGLTPAQVAALCGDPELREVAAKIAADPALRAQLLAVQRALFEKTQGAPAANNTPPSMSAVARTLLFDAELRGQLSSLTRALQDKGVDVAVFQRLLGRVLKAE